jgi:hypothetical protein
MMWSVFLSGNGQITHVINGVGATVNGSNTGTLSQGDSFMLLPR